MNLLKKHKQAQTTYWMMENEFRRQLKPYKEVLDKLQDEIELYILKNDIFLPYKDMVKLSGRIGRVNMIIEYGDGYRKIENLLFSSFDIKDGKLIDNSVYPPRFRWVRDNVYENWSLGEKSTHDEITVLGCYNLELNGVSVFDTQLEVLWKNT